MNSSKNYPHKKYIGRALIINNDDNSNSIYNVHTIEDSLNKLGFRGVQGENDVSVFTDIGKTSLMEQLKQAAENDWTDYTCFVCVILAYGEEGVILCPDDSTNALPCSLDDLQKPFKCEKLMNKPKLFLLQVRTESTIDMTDQPEPGRNANSKIPTDSDVLVHWCQKTDKSQDYIKALTEAIERHCIKNEGLDILRILTVINHKMCQKNNVPLVTSTLRKRLFLYPHNADK